MQPEERTGSVRRDQLEGASVRARDRRAQGQAEPGAAVLR
jgi:hypothetical protein